MKRSRTAVVILPLLALCACLAAFAPSAMAAESYAVDAIDTCPTDGSGQLDESGKAYVACGEFVRIYDTAGTLVSIVLLPVSTSDVAPSPDGRHIYFLERGNEVRRMSRSDAGAWSVDASWHLADFEASGGWYTPSGSRLHVDAWGDIYVASNGMFRPTSVLKYGPNGMLKNRFGNFGNELGNFTTLQGIAVARDGWTVYTVEHSTGRVQRFDYGLDGEYHVTSTWGSTDGACPAGAFVSPYDLGIDPWGFVYVMDAGCNRVQKFTATGTHVASIAIGNGAYGIAVDGNGNAIVANAEAGWRLRRTTATPGPWPALRPLPAGDKVAPVVSAVNAPATSAVRDITISITAADNVGGTGISDMRIANEHGNWGDWRAFATGAAVELSGGYGIKVVEVQVRDRAGNTSATFSAPVDYRGPADTTAPTISSVSLPASTTSANVTLAINAGDDTAVTGMRLSADGGASWSDWEAFAVTAPYTLPGSYGVKGVSVQVRDAAGNVSAVRTATTSWVAPADTQAPVIGSLTVPATTTTQAIGVGVAATDNVAVTGMRLANEDGTWGAWKAFAATSSHTLTVGFGAKSVSVQVRDAAGNESGVLTRPVQYLAPASQGDTSPPQITDVVVPASTPVQVVQVGIAATDDTGVTDMRLANEDGVWGAWKPFAATAAHTLTPGFGDKVVKVQVRDAAGNASAVVQRPTSYVETCSGVTQATSCGDGDGGGCVAQSGCGGGDIVPPAVTTATAPTQVSGQVVTIGVSASDDTSVTQVRLANEDGIWSAWLPFEQQIVHQLTPGNGTKTVYVQVRDGAGNESSITQVSTVVQVAVVPSITSIVAPRVTVRRTIPIRLTVASTATVTHMRFASRTGRWGTWRTFAPGIRYTLTPGYGPKYVYVQVRDSSGRTSAGKRIKVWYVIK